MAEKGKLTKTEIFCLALTGLFLLVLLVAALWRPAAGGVEIVTWKRGDAMADLPEKININTADEEALQQLHGIGPVLAGRIVAWREENGDYVIPEDLLAVEGIGLSTLEGIRDMITIEEEP